MLKLSKISGLNMVAKTKRLMLAIVLCLSVLFLGVTLYGCGEQTNTFTITVQNGSNGTVLSSESSAEAGQEITLIGFCKQWL